MAQLGTPSYSWKQWRNQLRDEVDRTVTHMQDEAANFPDPVDRAAQEEKSSASNCVTAIASIS